MVSEILDLTSEAAMIVDCNVVTFANTPARILLNNECHGKRLDELLGELAGSPQTRSFLMSLPVSGKHCCVRSIPVLSYSVVFITETESEPQLANAPMLYALRSCVMNINLSADFLRQWAEKHGDKALTSNVEALTRSYYRIIRLISNAAVFFDVSSQLSSGATSCDVAELCRELVDTIKGFTVKPELYMSSYGSTIATVDRVLFQQLLLNLISNSVAHAKGCTRISVNVSETPDGVLISVSDDGAGIPHSQFYQVMERYRCGYDLSSMGSGLGIGLTVCRKIAEMHGGILLIESKEGRGTTVRISLSDKRPSSLRMSSGDSGSTNYTQEVLVGMSDCFPIDFYSGKYMD